MQTRLQENQIRKSKRNLSQIQSKFQVYRKLQNQLQLKKGIRLRLNSIKISRNKLPPDFFPKTESLPRKISLSRPSLDGRLNYPHQQPLAKAFTQRNNISPQKTSLCDIREEFSIIKKNIGKTMNLKRQFESRDEPKRQKIYVEQRKYTPLNGLHRNQMLSMFQSNYDEQISTNLSLLLAKKDIHNTARKQKLLYNCQQRQQQILQMQDSVQYDDRQQNKKEYNNISTSGDSQDLHNITFFNSKSTSLPPIHKNMNIV